MEVYIFRHAQADFKSKDEDPPVSQKGMREAARVVKLAGERFGFAPSVAASSPLLRAKQTAEMLREELGLKAVVVDDSLYGDREPSEALTFLSRFKKDDNVALVSHMPLIFELLYSMTGGRSEVELLNGSIAAVRFKGKAAEGKGALTWLIQPGV